MKCLLEISIKHQNGGHSLSIQSLCDFDGGKTREGATLERVEPPSKIEKLELHSWKMTRKRTNRLAKTLERPHDAPKRWKHGLWSLFRRHHRHFRRARSLAVRLR